MRAALHAHILVFFKPREQRKDFKPLGAIPAVAPGREPRQRPRDSEVPEMKEKQEDNVYQKHHVGPITAELVRPDVSGPNWGEYDIEKLRIAGLARAVQMRLPYLHCCNPAYCLKDRSSCRFFFPWPYQPYTCFCENTQRVAMKRRLPEDDAFVVPHNLYLTMFSPSSVNVLAFDPLHGADHARAYATKYASKPEKWYFLETVADGLKNWLKARTVGVCMAFSRLLAFHVVRSTRPCVFVPACFIGKKAYRNLREAGHVQKCAEYPDPQYYLNYTQKYFFRHPRLRHLRAESFNRYLYVCGDTDNGAATSTTAEDTLRDEDENAPEVDASHRNFDEMMEATRPGVYFASTAKHVPGAKRRNQLRLGVSRVPFIEPIGASREDFYEAKLVLALPWYCPEMPKVVKNADGHDVTEWTFQCDPPTGDAIGGHDLAPIVLKLGAETMSFEVLCNHLEQRFCDADIDLICPCCAQELPDSVCASCRHAVGFHRCQNPNNEKKHFLWTKGSLHAGVLDVHRVLFNLHRKNLPDKALEEKAEAYVKEDLLDRETAQRILNCIFQERGTTTYLNDGVEEVPENAVTGGLSTKLSPTAMKELLAKRETMMKESKSGEVNTDQFRVYSHIIHCIETGKWLRLMVQVFWFVIVPHGLAGGMGCSPKRQMYPEKTIHQASAGTGKSFLLNTVFLYCLVHKKRCKAAAPTGDCFFFGSDHEVDDPWPQTSSRHTTLARPGQTVTRDCSQQRGG